jgi:hypothetical protein
MTSTQRRAGAAVPFSSPWHAGVGNQSGSMLVSSQDFPTACSLQGRTQSGFFSDLISISPFTSVHGQGS